MAFREGPRAYRVQGTNRRYFPADKTGTLLVGPRRCISLASVTWPRCLNRIRNWQNEVLLMLSLLVTISTYIGQKIWFEYLRDTCWFTKYLVFLYNAFTLFSILFNVLLKQWTTSYFSHLIYTVTHVYNCQSMVNKLYSESFYTSEQSFQR